MRKLEDSEERYFAAYTKHSGQAKPNRNWVMFHKLCQDGKGPHFKNILEMSLPVGNIFNEILIGALRAEANLGT